MGPALLDEIPKELIERYKGSWMGCNLVSRKTLRLNGLGADEYAEALRGIATRGDESLALYVHIPFCPVRCLYCGCNTNVTHDGGRIDEYLDLLEREMDLVVDHLGRGRRVVQLHVGGGTPNYLSDSQLARLMQMIDARFQRPEDAACIECNPRLASAGQLELLRGLGFTQISLGVQDLSPNVQRAIGRLNSLDIVRDVNATAREAGFSTVNMDLVCGLPEQNEIGFRQTIEQVIAMRPDRVRCYSYAHVPARQPHQFAIDQQSLPSSADRLALFHRAVIDFTQSGYTWIGADCFATAEDEWTIAQAERRLQRTCIGYTAVPANHLVALGTNGVGDVDGVIAQNDPRVDSWRGAILAGKLPVAWGRRLSDEDRRRRKAFEHLMCNLELPVSMAEGLDQEYQSLRECADDGLVEVTEDSVRVTPRGRYFLRDLCAKHAAGLDWDSAQWRVPEMR